MVTLSRTMDDLGERGEDRGSTKPVDVNDIGENRTHIGPGRDYAIAATNASGSVHPMEHAGKMGKGRW